MVKHKVATREEWLAARNQLLAKEKELTRRGDQLAAERRNLPWVPIEKQYRFCSPSRGPLWPTIVTWPPTPSAPAA